MWVVLHAVEVADAPRFAELPPSLRTAPAGFGWASAWLPTSAAQAEGLKWAVWGCAALALVGLFTRVTMVLTSALLLVVLALPQQWGSGVHTHHLWWFSVLLAAAPAGGGAALSLDAWRRHRTLLPSTASTPSVAVGVPVRAAWVCIGLIFFFPGWWKWRELGLGWAFSDNLLHQLHFKWLEHARLPAFRVDRWPTLLHWGALGVLVFEVLALPLVLFRRTRLPTVAAMLAFHLATSLFLFINFSSLWWCYLVFVPWSGGRVAPPAAPHRAFALPALAAAVIVVGQVVTGFGGLEYAWPFACYPTFRYDPGLEAPVLVAETEATDGTLHELDTSFLNDPSRGQHEWSEMWSVWRSRDPERLEAWWRLHETEAVKQRAVRVSVYAATRLISPDAPQGARRTELLVSRPLGAP